MSAPAVCSICWFAIGDGVSAHCGKCRCCERTRYESHAWSPRTDEDE